MARGDAASALRQLARVAWVAAVALACQIDRRAVELATDGTGADEVAAPDGSGSGRSGEGDGDLPLAQGPADPLTGVGPGALGAECQQNSDCGGANCVDGVCCDSPCTDLCAACNVAGSLGTCSAAPHDPLCPEASCQGQSSECRALGDGQTAINCETIGVCRANAECTVTLAAAGTPCQEGTGTCDGQGACLVPDKNALGEPCELPDDCAEGHCVASGLDGARVCCDAACDGLCQACSAAGRCEETPATDARCEPVACPADNVCRDYVETIVDKLCRSFGQCRGAVDCVSAGFFTSLRPNAQCVCDPSSGDCGLASATPCEQDGDCAAGVCGQTDQGSRLCCSEACGAGFSCSSTGIGCVQCEGAAVECDGNVQRVCNAGAFITTSCANGCTPGTGCNDLPPVGFPCEAGQCAAGGVCQQDTTGQPRCCVRSCAAEGKVCSLSGSCDCPVGQVVAGDGCLLRPGDPCQSGAQCQAGLACVDGVCCGEACAGFCERCQPGTGACVAVAAGQQDLDLASGNSCTNGFECTGARNGCEARTGQSCTSADGSDCVSGNCELTAGGGARVCCSDPCGGARAFCRSTGQGCVECDSAAQCGNGCNVVQGTCNPLRAPGATCSVSGQCSTNTCVAAADGGGLSRCCANCAAGQLCTAQGQCVNAQSELGGSCRGNSDCRVGVCASGVCCSAACDAACEACSSSGTCESNGACDAFDCIAPDPPPVTVNLPASDIFVLPGFEPPVARGGTVRDGRYVPTRIDIYGELTAGIFIPTYEFRGRSVQIAEQDYIQFSPPASFLPEMHYAGTYTTTGTSLSFDVELCEIQFQNTALRTQTVQYTATANGLIALSQQTVGSVVVTYTFE